MPHFTDKNHSLIITFSAISSHTAKIKVKQQYFRKHIINMMERQNHPSEKVTKSIWLEILNMTVSLETGYFYWSLMWSLALFSKSSSLLSNYFLWEVIWVRILINF